MSKKPSWQVEQEQRNSNRLAWLEALPEPQVFTGEELRVAETAVRAVFELARYDQSDLHDGQKEVILKVLKKSGWNPRKAAEIYDSFMGGKGSLALEP